MAKTNKQRQAEWKMRHPEMAKQENAKKNKAYRERLKVSLTEEEKQMKRKNEAERKRRWRLKKKEILRQSKEKAFATPQVKGKLLKRTRDSLKGTPEQNLCVLQCLINDYQDVTMKPLNSTSKQLPETTIAKVKSFYFNDDISRASPNVKDYVTVVENNERKKISVKHLMYPINEVYGMFCKENPDIKIGRAKFFALRPVNVWSSTLTPQNVCCCQIHENVRLCMKALAKVNAIFKDVHVDYNMHKNFVCDEPSKNCFMNDCSKCKNAERLKVLVNQLDNESQVVTWSKWIKIIKPKKSDKENKTDKTTKADKDDNTNQYCNVEKVIKTGCIKELLTELYELIPAFLDHEYVKINQAKAHDGMIGKAQESDAKCAVINVDFAETFKCCHQNEIQSAHYGQKPVSVFSVGIYHRGFTPMVISSDYSKHGKECILAYLDLVIDQLPATVEEIDIWSDNPVSQFKSQYIMEGIKSIQKRRKIKIKWNFFAAMHGKSVVDGIGGFVKRYVRGKILNENLLVQSAEDFASAASGMEVKVLAMKISDVHARNKLIGFDNIIKNSKAINGICKMHFFEVSKVGKIAEKISGQKITPHVNSIN